MAQNDKALLLRLKEQDVQFVVIGGVCGVLHGLSLVTLDLDICCNFSHENLRRLESALKDVHPRHRLAPNKPAFELTSELAARLKNLYLQTDLGIVDCLSEVAGLGNYELVLQHSVTHQMSYGNFQILGLDGLIAAKEAIGRERDLAAVKQLRGIKERQQARQSS